MIAYSETAMTITGTLQTNAIVWVQSLPESEMGPSRRILEDLRGVANNGNLRLYEYTIGDRTDLVEVFRDLSVKAREGLQPILHVDAHGTADDGLLLAPSGEQIGWGEVIDLLRNLNVATANNLTCVFALCFGLHLYKHVSLMKPVPAYIFFAPQSEVTVGFLEAQTLAFYRKIIDDSNVTTAFEATLGGNMQLFHCQGLFFKALQQYINTYCKGRQRNERQERMVTEILQRDGVFNPTNAQLREVRQRIKTSFKPDQSLIDKFAPIFLINRNAAFTYADIDRALNRSLASK